jgi:hypothetical protein
LANASDVEFDGTALPSMFVLSGGGIAFRTPPHDPSKAVAVTVGAGGVRSAPYTLTYGTAQVGQQQTGADTGTLPVNGDPSQVTPFLPGGTGGGGGAGLAANPLSQPPIAGFQGPGLTPPAATFAPVGAAPPAVVPVPSGAGQFIPVAGGGQIPPGGAAAPSGTPAAPGLVPSPGGSPSPAPGPAVGGQDGRGQGAAQFPMVSAGDSRAVGFGLAGAAAVCGFGCMVVAHRRSARRRPKLAWAGAAGRTPRK